VYCQLDYLGNCLPGRIRHALNELPDTLDGTYERTLREIKDTNWEFAQRLLMCVAVVSRPLRVEELAEILAFDFEAGTIPKYREDWRLEDPVEAVLSTCSTLLALVNIDYFPVIQFSHFSVKEFLISSRFAQKADTISRRYHISPTPAHTLVAQACLGILLHLGQSITEDDLRKFPLVEYAASHWFEHARFEGVSQETGEGMKQMFDQRKPHLTVWLWIYDPTEPFHWPLCLRAKSRSPRFGTGLHYAACCGLNDIVEVLAIEHPGDVNSQSFKEQSTPLHLASREGHVKVAQILGEHGADATAWTTSRRTPLHDACSGGHMELAWLLVKHGADVAAQDVYGLTPLHLASGEGHIELTQFLIEEHGADSAARAKDGLTPLHQASSRGHMEIARFLIEQHGANVAARDKYGLTPLHQASAGGYMELARFLIEEHGADSAAQDEYRRTLLHRASEGGHVELARFLIEKHGADSAAQDKEGFTPLHWASLRGHVELARFLIKEHDADTAARDERGCTPLHQASLRGHVELVQSLIEFTACKAEFLNGK
jgi:ankyrin repeat protein